MAKDKNNEIKKFEKLSSKLNKNELVLYETVCFGVFTNAYLALKRKLYSDSYSINMDDLDKEVQKIESYQKVIKEYEEFLFNYEQNIQDNVKKFIDLENGDVLDNAIANYLKINVEFDYDSLMAYFEERYSEKKIVKYIGNMPIYKRELVFERNLIESKLFDLIELGIIFVKNLGKDKLSSLEGNEFISTPIIFAGFLGRWNPLIIYPEVSEFSYEFQKVMDELMCMDTELNEVEKMLNVVLKEDNLSNVVKNIANMMDLYYEQIGGSKPSFLAKNEEGSFFDFCISYGEYETVKI
jgi:hypothetical protein